MIQVIKGILDEKQGWFSFIVFANPGNPKRCHLAADYDGFRQPDCYSGTCRSANIGSNRR